jgi:hypothetical protein
MATRKGSFAKTSKPVPGRLMPTPRGVDPKKPVGAKSDRVPPRTPPSPFDTLGYVKGLIRDVPDFPQPGILFRDITPLLADPRGFHIVLDAIAHHFVGEKVDAVVGVESRGFCRRG